MEEAIKRCVGVGDFVRVQRPCGRNSEGAEVLGEIVEVLQDADQLRCRIYSLMSSSILRQFSLPPITVSMFPIAALTIVSEVVAMNTFVDLGREDVLDIIFILPISELESGNVFITGCSNLYFVRYLVDGSHAVNFSSVHFFGRHAIQPLTIRIFHALNTLSSTIKKLMYHRPEAEDTKRSARIFFLSDGFNYIMNKMRDQTALKCQSIKNQRVIKYYDDLKSESGTKVVDVTCLRVLTQSSLKELRSIVGIGVGIGSAQYKPSKSKPMQYCAMNSILTSVECSPILPIPFLRNPLLQCYTDGIELYYHEQNSTLCCHVRFSRLRVSDAEVAVSRIPVAIVVPDNPDAHVGAWFHYNNNTFAIQSISNGICTCRSVEADDIIVELPIDIVNNLVNIFGN